jgi:hypothetical protein
VLSSSYRSKNIPASVFDWHWERRHLIDSSVAITADETAG